MAENLNFNRGIFADVGDFLPVQFPAQHHPGHAHGGAQLDTGQRVDRHLGGAVNGYMGGDLAAQLHHAPVLDDKGIHPRLGGGADEIPHLLQLPVRHQGIQGQVDLHPPDMAVPQGLCQGIHRKILCALPGVKSSNA